MAQTGFRRLSVPEGQGLGVFEGAADRDLGAIESGALDGIFHQVDSTSGSRECNHLALPVAVEGAVTRPLPAHATLLVDPDRPSESSPKRSFCVGFWYRYAIAACLILGNEAVSRL